MWLQRQGFIEPDWTPEIIDKLLTIIQAGDILGSYESGRWTSMFIKGDYDHVAMVSRELYVVEAVGDIIVQERGKPDRNLGGVRKVRLEQWLWKKNEIFIARHTNPHIAQVASNECMKYVGHNYDYSFCQNNEDMYCAEIPYVSYKKFDPLFMKDVEPTDEILPIDYMVDQHLIVIYDSRVKLEPTLNTASS